MQSQFALLYQVLCFMHEADGTLRKAARVLMTLLCLDVLIVLCAVADIL